MGPRGARPTKPRESRVSKTRRLLVFRADDLYLYTTDGAQNADNFIFDLSTRWQAGLVLGFRACASHCVAAELPHYDYTRNTWQDVNPSLPNVSIAYCLKLKKIVVGDVVYGQHRPNMSPHPNYSQYKISLRTNTYNT